MAEGYIPGVMHNLQAAVAKGKVGHSLLTKLRYNPQIAMVPAPVAGILAEHGRVSITDRTIHNFLPITNYVGHPTDPAAAEEHARRLVQWQSDIIAAAKGNHSLAALFGADIPDSVRPLVVRSFQEADYLRQQIRSANISDDAFTEITSRIARESMALRYLDHLVTVVDDNDAIARDIDAKIATALQVAGPNRTGRANAILYSGPSGVGKGEIFKHLEDSGFRKYEFVNTREVRPSEDGSEYKFLARSAELNRAIEDVENMTIEEKERLNRDLAEIAGLKLGVGIKDDDDQFRGFDNEKFNDREMAKRLLFWEIAREGGFSSIAMVRSDMQGVPMDFFTRVRNNEQLIIEVDATHARNLSRQMNFPRDRIISVMVMPPTGFELESRMMTRMTETPASVMQRIRSAAKDIEKSLNGGKPIHQYYVVNSELGQTVEDFERIIGVQQKTRVFVGDPNTASYKIADYVSRLNTSGRVPIDFKALNRGASEAELDAVKEAINAFPGDQLTNADLDAILGKLIAEGKISTSKVIGRICLQPGTDNPYHYGHATAGLAATIGAEANGYLTLSGGNVPDKPFASTKAHREAMANLTVADVNAQAGNVWAGTSPIRAEVADHFNDLAAKFGKNAEAQRSMMDILAFKFLIAKNPGVVFYYVIGSDKLESYAKKNERALIKETLSDGAMKVIFFQRTGMEMTDAKMYELMGKYHKPEEGHDINWLKDLWFGRDFFKESAIPSHAGASATKVRAELSSGNIDSARAEIPQSVLDYILTEHPELKDVFKLQNEHDKTMKSLNGLLAQVQSGAIPPADAKIQLQQMSDEIQEQKQRATILAELKAMEEAASSKIDKDAKKLIEQIFLLLS